MWLVYLAALILGGGVLFVQMLSGGGHDVGGPGIVSTRSITFGVAAFGLVGAPLHFLLSPGSTLALALVSGGVAAAAAGFAFARLGHPAASGAVSLDALVGRTAKVLVPCGKGQRGKVRAALGGQVVDVLATTDEAHIPAGTDVRVVEVRDEVAHVATGGSHA
jgi:membrane protein implicated in regulation of membrane protease activity